MDGHDGYVLLGVLEYAAESGRMKEKKKIEGGVWGGSLGWLVILSSGGRLLRSTAIVVPRVLTYFCICKRKRPIPAPTTTERRETGVRGAAQDGRE